MTTWIEKLGWTDASSPRTILVYGSTPAQFEAADPLFDRLAEAYPRMEFACASDDPATRVWLQGRYPDHLVVTPPFDIQNCINRFAGRLNPRLAVILESAAGLGPRLARRLSWWRIPSVLVNGKTGGDGAVAALGDPEVWRHIEHLCVERQQDADRLLALGMEKGRLSVTGGAGPWAEAVMQALGPMMRRDLKELRSESRPVRGFVEEMLPAAMGHRVLRRLLAFKAHRIDSLDVLKAALSNPRTILCLGNGPSSEDPALADVAHDCLFRVNDMWLKRGFLTAADVVFTGDRDALYSIPDTIFAFQTRRAEGRLLRGHVFSRSLKRIRYIVLERLDILFDGTDWGAKPTNGAAMLAIAVALQPDKLVISGIDLFQHPAGTYPGDTGTPNAYMPLHERDVELRILTHHLDRYRGELVISNEILRDQLQPVRSAGTGE